MHIFLAMIYLLSFHNYEAHCSGHADVSTSLLIKPRKGNKIILSDHKTHFYDIEKNNYSSSKYIHNELYYKDYTLFSSSNNSIFGNQSLIFEIFFYLKVIKNCRGLFVFFLKSREKLIDKNIHFMVYCSGQDITLLFPLVSMTTLDCL